MKQGKHSVNNDGTGTDGAAAAKRRNPLAIIVGAIVFLALAVAVFAYANVAISYNGTKQDKGTYNAFDSLERDTVDAVFIGTSATSRYFVPGVAYEQDGLASFVIAPPQTPAILYDNIIDLVEQTQSPKLYVIELRNVMGGYDAVNEVAVRKTTDSIKLTKPQRYQMIDEALAVMRKQAPKGSYDDSRLDYYLPIVKYHSRLTSTSKKERIDLDDLLLKEPYNTMQGYQASAPVLDQASQKPGDYQTSSSVLDDDVKEILDGLLDYCDKLDADVLFTIAPYSMSADESQTANAVADYVEARGFDCLNCNADEIVDEIGLDWNDDFYNNHHVNYVGAQKYTRYLSKYLMKRYGLEDHSGDARYSAWESGYQDFLDYTSVGLTRAESSVADEE